MREKFEAEFSLTNIMLGRGKGLEELLSGDMNALLEDGEEPVGGISEEVESKFLTMSWWMLHVGWKDIGERVRRGVEEVFDGYASYCSPNTFDTHYVSQCIPEEQTRRNRFT
jgi:peroxin-3